MVAGVAKSDEDDATPKAMTHAELPVPQVSAATVTVPLAGVGAMVS